MALKIEIAKNASKYLQSLDKPTRERIHEKLLEIAEAPTDARLSKPLVSVGQRSARVGSYRILFTIEEHSLFVAAIGPRGQIYR